MILHLVSPCKCILGNCSVAAHGLRAVEDSAVILQLLVEWVINTANAKCQASILREDRFFRLDLDIFPVSLGSVVQAPERGAPGREIFGFTGQSLSGRTECSGGMYCIADITLLPPSLEVIEYTPEWPEGGNLNTIFRSPGVGRGLIRLPVRYKRWD